jgi:hypothetical protein
LIALAAVAFLTGAVLAFSQRSFLLAPAGYWRGAMGFLLFAVTLRLMEEKTR